MLTVVRAAGLITVQDAGRRGWMHEAVPPGGALVRELLAAANRAARNPPGAAAIEVLGRLVVRADADVAVATDREGGRTLRAGDELVVISEPRRVAYLAVRGGVDAPVVLGGRGTLLCAGIGRPLRAGDRIAVAAEPAAAGDALRGIAERSEAMGGGGPAGSAGGAGGNAHRGINEPRPIRVIPGPDPGAFAADALATLARAPYRVLPASDRVGTRLAGAAITRVPGGDRALSRPMVCGAIEVPADGMPIVLGPEHPTTGGYPLIGVVAAADLDRLFAIRLGGEIRFAIASGSIGGRGDQ